MPLGPGKHDAYCTQVREETKATGVVLIVIGPEPGFSCQADAETTLRLPDILENVARQIRASFEQGRV
jgi:hypothetical protein